MQRKFLITSSIILLILALCGCGNSANGGFDNESVTKPPSLLPGINKDALLGIDEAPAGTEPGNSQDTDSDTLEDDNKDEAERDQNAGTADEGNDSEILQIQKLIDELFVKELKAAKAAKEAEDADNPRGTVEQPADPQKEKALEKIRDKYEKEYFVADDSCMIAALLYKETGEAKYRKEAEEHLLETAKVVSEGGEVDLVRRRSLYYGIFVYLRTDRSTDYNLSESLMKIIMDTANAKATEDSKATEDDFAAEGVDEISALTNAHLLFLANLVTTSPEYVRRADEYMKYAGNESSEFVSYELKETAYMLTK